MRSGIFTDISTGAAPQILGGNMYGTLFLVGTPIGNLEDMSYRAIRTLKEADIIAAEDTRNSIKLLNHFEINVPMTSYHEYNKTEKGHELIAKLQEGKNIALITDAGMPGISDPGEELVAMAHAAHVTVSVVPGPSAVISALVISGLPTRCFSFYAFLPADNKPRKKMLTDIAAETKTLVLYEAPHHLLKTLKDLREALGNRSISVVKELTKKHEKVLRTDLDGAILTYENEEPKGEYVLVIAGRDAKEVREEEIASWTEMPVEEHMKFYTDQGFDRKEAMKLVAKDRGVGKREIYSMLTKNSPE